MNTNDKKVWLITGASRGLGFEIAKAALEAGDAVAATGRNADAVAARFGQSESLLALSLDVTNESSIAAAVARAVERFGRIDVLVNNAGYGLVGAIEESSADDVRKLFETNVFGLLSVTRAVLPQLRKQRSGHVMNVSSIGGYRAAAGFGVYSSTKFAVEGISEALRDELAPLGIDVTVVEPGYFRTEFLEANSAVVSKTVIEDYAETSGKVRAFAKQVSLNQPGDPRKLAKALVELSRVKNAPLRLPLGSDTVAAIEKKNDAVLRELAAWREVSVSTDFPK